MPDHSKAVGYAAAAILLAAIVSWSKYSLIPGAMVAVICLGMALFFVSWRAATGTWPGNDASR